MGLFHWGTLDNTVKDRYGDRDLIAGHSPSFDVGKVTQKAGRTSRGSSSNTEKTFYVSVDRTVIDTSLSVSLGINIDSDLTSGYCSPFIIGNGSAWDGYSVRFGLVYYYANNKLAFNIANGTSYKTIDSSATGITLERHKGYHIAAIYKYGKSISLYINGKKVAEQSTNIVPILAGYYCVGGNDTDHYAFDGLINDIKVYDYALSPIEIKKLAQGLACHFTFNFEDFYTPVDYLEGTGSQRIKLDITPTSKYKIEEVFSMTNTLRTSCLWCARGNSTTANSTTAFYIDNTGVRCDYGISATQTNIGSLAVNTIHTLTMDAEKGYLDGTLKTSMTVASFTAGNKIELFASYVNGQDAGLDNYSTIKIYSFKVGDENRTLVGDFMPCVRNTDNKPGLYDGITNTFYTNVNTSSQTDFKAPYYTLVEYIESNGTQYIDTGGYNQTNDYRVQLTFCLTSSASSNQVLFGNRGSSNRNYIQYVPADSPDLYGGIASSSKYGPSQGTISLNTIYTASLNRDTSNYLAFNIWTGKFAYGTPDVYTNVGATSASDSGLIPMYLFAACYVPNDSTTYQDYYANYYTSMKLYGCKITKDSDPTYVYRDFVPARSLATGELGLYDRVEDKFYTNKGSGSFTTSTPLTHMVDCSGYLIDGNGTNITESKDTAGGNSCAVFNGINSQIVGSYKTDGLTNLTYTAGVYQTTRTNERACICIGGTYLTIDDGGHLSGYAYGKSPAGYHTGSKVIPLNQGTHIAITGNDEYIYGYINGIEDFKVACTGTFSYAVNQQIGMEGSSSRAFNGKIADLRIYATALSAKDIKELYESRIEIDSHKNLFCGNIVERDGGIELTKENILNVENIGEEGNKIEIEKIDNNIDSSIYDRLEYIESSGTQYIDTDIGGVDNSSISFEITQQHLSNANKTGSGHHRALMGVSNGKAKVGYFESSVDATEKSICKIVGDSGLYTDTLTQTSYINSVVLGSRSTQPYDHRHYLLFACPQGGDSAEIGIPPYDFDVARIYSSKFGINDTLVRNFIPVKRRIDNEIGLFDTITKEFYTNKGTGTFIEGPVLKNRVIVNNIIED